MKKISWLRSFSFLHHPLRALLRFLVVCSPFKSFEIFFCEYILNSRPFPMLANYHVHWCHRKLIKQRILLQSLLVLFVKVVLLKFMFEFNDSVIFWVFSYEIFVKPFNVEANFIEQEIHDCQVLEDITLGLAEFF